MPKSGEDRGTEARAGGPAVDRRERGSRGEGIAAAWLDRRGYRILARNVRCRLGEIDIVAADGRSVVFVEVKGKGGGAHGRPEEMVTRAKRRRLTLLARWYLQQRGWLARPARFDVVAIDWGPAGAAVRHIVDAFPAEGAW